MGGAEAVLEKARQDYARAEYRWVAQVASQLVFADPANRDARELAADAFEQLGYQSESATARNAYLQGAFELRNGVPNLPGGSGTAPDIVRSLPLEMYFDFMAVRLDGDKAAGKKIVLNWRFTDTKQNFVLNLENSALTYVDGMQADNADATLTLNRATLDEISMRKTTFELTLETRQIAVAGKTEKLVELLGMLDTFPIRFPVVEPRPVR
jgi:alkyl sulfatase BDS1-like metallo-beta-lactamase superfamily hydrolase